MGMVRVARAAAIVVGPPPVTMTSTCLRASSFTSAGRRSSFPSAAARSINRFWPGAHPSSFIQGGKRRSNSTTSLRGLAESKPMRRVARDISAAAFTGD
jgi:hypothetical protein